MSYSVRRGGASAAATRAGDAGLDLVGLLFDIDTGENPDVLSLGGHLLRESAC